MKKNWSARQVNWRFLKKNNNFNLRLFSYYYSVFLFYKFYKIKWKMEQYLPSKNFLASLTTPWKARGTYSNILSFEVVEILSKQLFYTFTLVKFLFAVLKFRWISLMHALFLIRKSPFCAIGNILTHICMII